jgi:hypothetical protein
VRTTCSASAGVAWHRRGKSSSPTTLRSPTVAAASPKSAVAGGSCPCSSACSQLRTRKPRRHVAGAGDQRRQPDAARQIVQAVEGRIQHGAATFVL